MAEDPTKFLIQGNMGQEAEQREINQDTLNQHFPRAVHKKQPLRVDSLHQYLLSLESLRDWDYLVLDD